MPTQAEEPICYSCKSMVSVVEDNLRAGVRETSKECDTHTVDGKSNAGCFNLEVLVNCVLHLIS